MGDVADEARQAHKDASGVFRMGEARIIDRTGDMHLPIGDGGFGRAHSPSSSTRRCSCATLRGAAP